MKTPTAIFSFLLALAVTAAVSVPASVHASESGTVIHVATGGADSAPGTAEQPVQTITKALEKLAETEGPVHIKIAPGTYREGGLRVGRRNAPTLIEAAGDGDVVISGSDVWSDWEQRGDTLVANWPYDWGKFDLDAGYPGRDHESFRPAGQRSELVFVDGERMTQVVTAEEMAPGSYRVDEDADELILQLPEGSDASEVLIEVGIRPNLIVLMQVQDVTLRGLTFQHAVSHAPRKDVPFAAHANAVFGEHVSGMTNSESNPDRNFAERVTIEDCKFIHNNRSGLIFANVKDMNIRHSRFDDNGIIGISANRGLRVSVEDSTLNRNNWRMGLLGHVIGWGPAGTKMLFMKDLSFTRCEVSDNYASGLWLDTSVNYVTVDDCVMEGNWGTGFYYEHNQGPALVKNSLIRRNGYNDGSRTIRIGDGGVLFAESEGLTIQNSRIQENINYQIGMRPRDRKGICYWTERMNDGACRDLTLIDNIIMGSSFDGDNAPEFYKPREHRLNTLIARQAHGQEDKYTESFLPTYTGSGNRFYNSITKRVFSTGPNWGYDRITLEAWQKLTNQDLDSAWAPGP